MVQQHRFVPKFSGKITPVFGILLVAILSIAWRYGEDFKTKNTVAHSTFHYELTRVLCRAAGFTADEAELIAVADEATDTGEFRGEFGNSPAVVIDGTQRAGKNVLYWHFARRDSSSATGGWSYPGGRNTCSYFTGTADACAENSELSEIEKWAVGGINALSVDVPAASVNGGIEQPVAGKSSLALAIYLHALADSYSHEACMKATRFRGHKPRPQECTAVYWHEQAEFGSVPSRDAGVPYTVEAAWATWLAVKWFRQQNGLTGPPLWSDEQARQFIEQWAARDQARDRREIAMTAWQALQ